MKGIHDQLVEKMSLIYSLSEAVYDAKGLLVDFKLVEKNPAFDRRFAGKNMSEWLFRSEQIPANWLRVLSELDMTGGRREFEEPLQVKDKMYLVTAFVPQSGQLVVLLHDAFRFQEAQLKFDKAQAKLEASLVSTEAFSQSVFQNNPSAIIIYEVKGDGTTGGDYIIRAVNSAALKVENWQEEKVIGKPLGVVRPGVEGFGIIDIFREVWETGETIHYPANVYREDSEYRWFENIVFRLPTGEVVAIYSDVTESKLAEIALFAEKEKLRVTLYSIGDAVITTDVHSRVEMLNPMAENLTGWKQEQAIGQSLSTVFDIYNEATGKPSESPVEKVLQTGKIVGVSNHTILKAKDGHRRSIDDSAAPIRDAEGKLLGVILVFRDITEIKEREARIEYLSFRDSLTGLYNRVYFEEEYKRLDRESHYPLTLIMGDLDGLKLMNDAFGHEAGDEALNKIANIIRSCCQPTDIVSRWGGDEFVVLLPDTTEQLGQRICDRIKLLAGATEVAGTKLQISLGCATKLNQNESREEVLRRAENNMFTSKLLGARSYRNVVLESIKKTLFEKSYETEEHGKRMGEYCRAIGERLVLSNVHLDELEVFSMLHDIGKIGISEHILQKPGTLTTEEWKIMRKHPEIGHRIASTVPELAGIADYILAHHERWDGTGYPKGLAGEEIPLLARILSVVDAYDAMIQDRPYRQALSVSQGKQELQKNAGTQFDPKIVDIFLEYLDNEKSDNV